MSRLTGQVQALLWIALGVVGLAAVGHADVYPLDKCIVSGQPLGTMGDPIVFDYKGREVRFCCPACKPKFEAQPDAYLKKIDEAIVAQQKPYYPVDTCPVTGKKLDEKTAVNYVYQNRLVRFCCGNCIAPFEKEPAKYLAILDKAVIAKQKPTYPLTTCVSTGEKLGPNAVDYVSGNRLVRFCCKDCIADFQKNPLKYFKQIDDAAKKAPAVR